VIAVDEENPFKVYSQFVINTVMNLEMKVISRIRWDLFESYNSIIKIKS
jgi:hypothetical protein